MPEQDIPCEDCQKMKEQIERPGNAEVVSCDPIPDKEGWCRLIWKLKED